VEGCDDEREIIGGDEEVIETWLACCGFKIPAVTWYITRAMTDRIV